MSRHVELLMRVRPEIRSGAELETFLQRRGPWPVAIWDFDGVVGDTEPLHAEAYRRVLKRRGVTTEPRFFDDLAGNTESVIWSRLIARYSVRDDPEALRRERVAEVIPLLTSIAPNWFVRPMLKQLASLSVPSIILSAGNPEVVDACLDAWGLSSSFAATEVLGGTGAEPDAKTQVLESRLRQGATSLVIEDSAKYLGLANALGATTIGISHSVNAVGAIEADAVLTSGEAK